MALDATSLGINELSVGERLELIELIWESLPESVSPGDVPPEHLAELQKRRAAMDAHPGEGKPWREVLDRLGKKS
jgi:putative addiction module component (TIGR02574 family)